MKVLIKYFALIVILGVTITGFISCSNASATKAPPFPKGDYPPAPSNLMKATLTKMDGSSFKLDDYKGKVLLVNVWATWCGPCRHEIPELIKLQAEHKNKGFEIIGLDVDESESPEMIKDFGKAMGVNYELVRGDGELFEEFYKISQRNAIPQSFLIDRDGKLLGVFVGGGKALQKLVDSTHRVMAE